MNRGPASGIAAWRPCAIGCLLAAFAIDATALPDDLDATFGVRGVFRLTDLPGEIRDVAVDDAGRLYVAVGCTNVAEGRRGVLRLLPDGSADASFGPALGYTDCPPALDGGSIDFMDLTPDGGVVVVSDRHVVRYDGRGRTQSIVTMALPRVPEERLPLPRGSWYIAAHAVDRVGRLLTAGTILCGDAGFCLPFVMRWNADGSLDRSFGDSGVGYVPVPQPLPGVVTDIAFHRDDRIAVVITGVPRIVVGRMRADGRPDPSFGIDGVVSIPQWGNSVALTNAVIQPDDKLVVAGSMLWNVPGEPAHIVFALRFDEAGFLDHDFGDQGAAIPRTLTDASRASVALQRDGKLLIAAAERSRPDEPESLLVARLDTDGSPDLHFGAAGFASLPLGYGGGPVNVVLAPDGRIAVLDALRVRDGRPDREARRYPVIYRLEGGTAPLPRPFREKRAIEYVHGGFGHYFVTAQEIEIENLDVHAPGGWERTGRAFRVWSHADSSAAPVCRFFSNQAFAPRSSHFYTSYASECESLRHGGTWTYEGTAFYLEQPVGAPGAAACPVGSRPLYRAYNNGQGGAPNHRYTIDPAVLDEMIAKSWTFEGEAATRVFACVPLLQ